MTRYADPLLCPDCRATLPTASPSAGPLACPRCALPLDSPLASRLLSTLYDADRLLTELRLSAPVPVPTPAPVAVPTPAPAFPTAVPVTSYATPYPSHAAPAPAPTRRRTLKPTSVPQVLLGLGALCLLVASVTFLAVAWSFLGVGGRTAVLVALTVAALGAGSALAGRRLRTAGEALTTVGLGLVCLDVVGARDAGWFGDLGDAGGAAVVGAALAAVALALVARGVAGGTRLAAPQVGAVLGVMVAFAGLAGATDHGQPLAFVAVVVLLAMSVLGRVLDAPVLRASALAGAAPWWVVLGLLGLGDAVAHTTLRGVWLEGHGLGLLAAAALALAPLLPLVHRADPAGDRPDDLQLIGGTVAALGLTVVALLPAIDETTTRATLAGLAALVALTAAALLVGRAAPRWRVVPLLPVVFVAAPIALVAAGQSAVALTQLIGERGVFTATAGLRLTAADAYADPLLLAPVLLALVAVVGVLTAELPAARRVPWWSVAGSALVLGVVGTLVLEGVALWLPVALLLTAAAVAVADALRRTEPTGAAARAGVLVSAVLAGLATVSARPSDVLSVVCAVVLVGLGMAVRLRGRFDGGVAGSELVLPVAVAWLLWSGASVVGVEASYRAFPVLVVLLLAAAARPRPELETSAWLTGAIAMAAAVGAAPDLSVSLAVHLTLAGALVTVSALVHDDRRGLGWAGGLLLAMATWVRLADLGVVAPEAYTLPSAVALLAVGLVRLWRRTDVTTSAALTPGLLLGTVPSLLWVLVTDPVSARAALLGLACLGLVLAGVRLHWNAPVVVGAVVGALVVLRELAPYAAATPQWVVIGLAGSVLTAVGVTWERRLRDLQLASSYLARLR